MVRWLLPQPADWLKVLARPETENELQAVRRGCPFGGPRCQMNIAVRLDLEFTLRPRGRPRKEGRCLPAFEKMIRKKLRPVLSPFCLPLLPLRISR